MNAAASSGRNLLTQGASRANVARYVVRAILTLAVTYVVARLGMALVRDRSEQALHDLGAELIVAVVMGGTIIVTVSAIPIRRQLLQIRDRTAANEADLRAQNESRRFLRSVSRAFDMADHEVELFEVAGLALRDAGPGDSEILVADASNAHVERVAVAVGRTAPGCDVGTPRSCPAVRYGSTLSFADPNGLSSCPRLRERQLPDGTVATCIPVNIMGIPSAVVHAVCDTTGGDVDLAAGIRALEGVGSRFGQRLGMMRAMAQSRLQADTDPLTGLLNRRAMENQVRDLRSDGVPFALAMADLDHFKDLNDTFGHDTGDRALRLFSRVLTRSVRDGDIVCRHGGEEFLIVLVGLDVTTAAPALHRLRANLADALAGAPLPTFTVSIGLVDSTWAQDLQELIRAADRALLTAKATGRDRLVIDDPSRPSDEATPPGPIESIGVVID